jgi:hypothetical protein
LLRVLGACVQRSKERRGDRGQAPTEASADMPHAVMQVCLPACLAAWHVAFFFREHIHAVRWVAWHVTYSSYEQKRLT